jgi:hypothetical protein
MSKAIHNKVTLLLTVFYIIFGFIQLKQNYPLPRPADFSQYYISSHRLISGLPIYSPLAKPDGLPEEIKRSFKSDVRTANPPPFIIFLLPLALLPYYSSWFIIWVLSAIAIGLSSFLTARSLEKSKEQALMWALISLSTYPALISQRLNHIESIIFLFAILGWRALREDKERIAGILWGTCAAMKLFPGLWIVLLFFAGRRKAAYSGALTAFFWFAAGALILGPSQVMDFLNYVLPQADTFTDRLGNHSILAIFNILGWPALGFILSFVTISLAIYATYRNTNCDRVWVIGCVTSLLCSPLCWSYYLTLAFPALMITLYYLEIQNRLARFIGYILFGLTMFWPGLFGGFISFNTTSRFHAVASVAGVTVGMILLLGLGCCWVGRGEMRRVRGITA